LLEINISEAKPEMKVAKTIYSREGKPLLRKGTILTDKYISKLIYMRIKNLYIDLEVEDVNEVVTQHLEFTEFRNAKTLVKDTFPDIISYETRQLAENVVKDIMDNCKMGRIVNTKIAKEVVEKIANEVIGNSKIISKLADIRVLDDYTFTHSVNVCILSIACGVNLKIDRTEVIHLGIGALLHDIGKVKVPLEILNKPGELTEDEFNQIKKHSYYGYELLRSFPYISAAVASVALQHHERFNGSGYPNGIEKKEISKFAQIVSIADMYDALTADRVYKKAILPYEASEIILASSGNSFPPDLVKAFVENTAIYPVESIVQLNDDRMGQIIETNKKMPFRPIIRLVEATGDGYVENSDVIDLMDHNTIFIKKIIKFKDLVIS
jgi:HD-GYP domain-containing protein (c-di-GMP phosphodiesterase class II)